MTEAPSTIRALSHAEQAVGGGGCISVTIYPGHEEGLREEEAVLEHAAHMTQDLWSVYREPPPHAPSLALVKPEAPSGSRAVVRTKDHASARCSAADTTWLNQRNKRNGRRAPSLVLMQKLR